MTIGNPDIKFNLPFTLGLPDVAPNTVDPKIKPVLDELYSAFQQVQLALHNLVGIGQQLQALWPSLRYDQTLHLASPWRYYVKASEAIAYGNAVNVFNDGSGILQARNANATNNTKPCHGFCTTSGGIAAGSYGEVILQAGLLTGVSGLTIGTRYFLFTTNGLISAAAPVAAGNIEQAVGWAIDSTALLFNVGFAFVQH